MDSIAFEPRINADRGAHYFESSAQKKQNSSGTNALLSLISTEDFEGIRNQIHSKIKDKIEENPASEETEAEEEMKITSHQQDSVIGGACSPKEARRVETNNFLEEAAKSKPVVVRDYNNIT